MKKIWEKWKKDIHEEWFRWPWLNFMTYIAGGSLMLAGLFMTFVFLIGYDNAVVALYQTELLLFGVCLTLFGGFLYLSGVLLQLLYEIHKKDGVG